MTQLSKKLLQFVPFLDHFLVQIEQMYFPNFPKKLATIWALPGSPLIPQSGQTYTYKLYFSKLQNIFLQITEYTFSKCNIFLSKIEQKLTTLWELTESPLSLNLAKSIRTYKCISPNCKKKSPNCKTYFFQNSEYTFSKCNISLSLLNKSWWQFERYWDHLLSLNLAKPTHTNCISPNCRIYFSKVQNIFLQITEHTFSSCPKFFPKLNKVGNLDQLSSLNMAKPALSQEE